MVCSHVSAVLDHEDDECVQQSVTLICASGLLTLLIALQQDRVVFSSIAAMTNINEHLRVQIALPSAFDSERTTPAKVRITIGTW